MENVNFLLEYINIITLGLCLCLGFAVKTAFNKIPNKYIPLGALLIGVIINVLINYPGINAQVVLGGMISGLASTGLYEMVRNLIDKDGKKE